VAPSVPCSCYSLAVLTVLLKKASRGLRVPECSGSGGGALSAWALEFDGLDPGRGWPGSDLVCIEVSATS
jgi:hypothetical protein